jgi:hypothetical protein
MGLKGYRLWVMGQLDSTCRAPPREVLGQLYHVLGFVHERRHVRHVAVQVKNLLKQILKPGFPTL